MDENYLLALLRETEGLCGKHPPHVSDVLKSIGILFHQQGRRREAERAFVRMDRLRRRDSPAANLFSDLESLPEAHLTVQNKADAHGISKRYRVLCTHIQHGRPSICSRLGDESHQQGEFCCADMRVLWARWQTALLQRLPRSRVLFCEMPTTCSESTNNCRKVTGGQQSIKCNNNFPVDELMQGIEQNAASSSALSYKSHSVFSDPIRVALKDPRLCYFFRIGNVTSTLLLEEGGGSRRFLATVGVFSCITVFAWTLYGTAVAAHVYLDCVLGGVRRCIATGQDLNQALLPLTRELQECFRGLDPTSVHITLVGVTA